MLPTLLETTVNVSAGSAGSLAVVVGAAIAAVGAVSVYWLQTRAAARERKRKMCAQALGDALAWLELPYRVRRRTSDTAQTLAGLAAHAHDLQEKLLFHSSWLCIELPDIGRRYNELLVLLKNSASEPLREAWNTPATATPQDMNVGELFSRKPVDAKIQEFCDQVAKELKRLF